jgi:transposase
MRRSLWEVVMARSKTGEAISPARRTTTARKKLRRFIEAAEQRSDLAAWRRGRAVLGSLTGTRVIALAEQLDVTRGAINRWLQWYEALGVEGLVTRKAPGSPRKLSDVQRAELVQVVEAGPHACGYMSGVWTGPMIGDVIEKKFGVRYHNHTVPRMLHELGFSVQRPRKRLARADVEAQDVWLRERLPAIKKRQRPAAAS